MGIGHDLYGNRWSGFGRLVLGGLTGLIKVIACVALLIGLGGGVFPVASVHAHPSEWEGIDQVPLGQSDVDKFLASVTKLETAMPGSGSQPAGRDDDGPLDRIFDWSKSQPAEAERMALQLGYNSFAAWQSVAHSVGLAYQHLTVGSEADEIETQTKSAIARLEKDASLAEEQKRDVIDALKAQLAEIKRPLPANVKLLSTQLARLRPLIEVPDP